MSDTIEVRHQSAKESWLFQQHPRRLISAVERYEVADPYRYATYCGGMNTNRTQMTATNVAGPVFTGLSHTFLPDFETAAVSVVTGLLTGTVQLLDIDHPTGAPRVVHKETPASSWAWAEAPREPLQQVAAEAEAKPAPSAAARLRVERLAAIQAALGLPVQVLAEVLRISRPCLYKWLDASRERTLQEASRQRLAAVERVARLWRERSNAPLNSVAHEPLAGGRSVLGLLTDENINEAAVIGAFDELIEKLRDKPKSYSQRMAESGFTRRKSNRSLPDDE